MELVKRVLMWLRQESGQTLVEYGLIIALVAIVLIGALTLLAGGLGDVFQTITNAI